MDRNPYEQFCSKAKRVGLFLLKNTKDGALVPLDAAYHQQITNEFRSFYQYRQGSLNSVDRLNLMKIVYSKFPLPPGYGW